MKAAAEQADEEPVAARRRHRQEAAPLDRRPGQLASTVMATSISAMADEEDRRRPASSAIQDEASIEPYGPSLRPGPGRSPWRCSCARTRSRARRGRWSARRPRRAAPQSMPAAETVRVIVAAIGLALTEVSVRASSSSTQQNMKQKKAVTPMPMRSAAGRSARRSAGRSSRR